MQAALVAYRTLVDLARVDGRISEDERRLLDRYRVALGLEEQTARLAELEPGAEPPRAGDLSPAQSVHVLKMMIRVAHADGTISERERRRLEEVADRLGIGRVKYAGILVDIENEARGGQRVRRSFRGLLVALAVLVVVVGIVGTYLVRRSATTEETGRLRARIDEMTIEQAARDEEIVRRSVEGSVGIAAFKEVESRFGPSVVLIIVAYDLVRGDQITTHWSSGTGFFITPDGLIVTNKHVIQPWKFSAELVAQIDAGFTIDEDSLRVGAWPTGANLRSDEGEFDVDSGYFNGDGTLEIYRTTEDQFELRPNELPDGSVYMALLHAMGSGDLAVLKAEVSEPVRPFPLPRALPGVEKLDPVMVLGFPRGIALLEGSSAELSVALGEVSKIERSIMITAPVVPGNSGGPAVDREGRVIGVATLTPGQGLGICLGTQEFLALLPGADELIASASESLALGRTDDARAYLDLAALRDPSPEQRAQLEELRGEFYTPGL